MVGAVFAYLDDFHGVGAAGLADRLADGQHDQIANLDRPGGAMFTRPAADITVLRSQAEPFRVEQDGRVANQVRVRIGNRSRAEQVYTITVLGAEGGEVIAPESPLTVKANALRTTSLFILLPRSAFVNGEHDVTIRITAGPGYTSDTPFNLLGPVAAAGSTP